MFKSWVNPDVEFTKHHLSLRASFPLPSLPFFVFSSVLESWSPFQKEVYNANGTPVISSPLPQFLCAQAIWHPVFLSSSCRIFCRVEQVVCREYTHPCDRSCTDCKILEQVSFLLNFADSSCIFYAKGNLLLIAVNMYKHFYTSYLPHTRVPPSHVPCPADRFPLLLFNRSGVALGGAC